MPDFADKVKAEISSLQKEFRRLDSDVARKIDKMRSIENQIAHLHKYLTAKGTFTPEKSKSTEAEAMATDIRMMSAAKAASVLLFPDHHLTFDELYESLKKRGYRFGGGRVRSNLRAALHSSSHISRDADGKYYLRKAGDSWWQGEIRPSILPPGHITKAGVP